MKQYISGLTFDSVFRIDIPGRHRYDLTGLEDEFVLDLGRVDLLGVGHGHQVDHSQHGLVIAGHRFQHTFEQLLRRGQHLRRGRVTARPRHTGHARAHRPYTTQSWTGRTSHVRCLTH